MRKRRGRVEKVEERQARRERFDLALSQRAARRKARQHHWHRCQMLTVVGLLAGVGVIFGLYEQGAGSAVMMAGVLIFLLPTVKWWNQADCYHCQGDE